MSVTLILALALTFASASTAYAGSAMQAFEARKIPRDRSLHPALLVELLRRPLWIGGTVMNIVAFGGQVVALGLASLAIVQPTFALGLVVLVAIARWKLSESVGVRELAGIAAIVLGLAGLAFVAPRHNHLPIDWKTDVVLAVGLVLIAAILAGMRVAGRSGGLAASVAAGVGYSWISFTGTLLNETFKARLLWASAIWAVAIVAAALLAVTAEMTALQSWPLTRSKPVVFVLQTLLPAFASPFFSAQGFGPGSGAPFVASLGVVSIGAAAVASGRAVTVAQGA